MARTLSPPSAGRGITAQALDLRLRALELWLEDQQRFGSIVTLFMQACARFQAALLASEASATRALLGLYFAERGEREPAIQCLAPLASARTPIPAWLTAFARASLIRLGQPSIPSPDQVDDLHEEDRERARWVAFRCHPLVDVHDSRRMLHRRIEGESVFDYLLRIGALEEAMLCAADLALIYDLLGYHQDLGSLNTSLHSLAENVVDHDPRTRHALHVFAYIASEPAPLTSLTASIEEVYRSLSSLHRFEALRVVVAASDLLVDLPTTGLANDRRQ